MESNLSSFQSAIQLVSGANLAIFALPKLGLDKLEVEEKRWESKIEALRVSEAAAMSRESIEARADLNDFRKQRDSLLERNSSIRKFALAISMASAIYLIYMSMFPNDPPSYVTMTFLFVGWMPAIILIGRDRKARKLILESSHKRVT